MPGHIETEAAFSEVVFFFLLNIHIHHMINVCICVHQNYRK